MTGKLVKGNLISATVHFIDESRTETLTTKSSSTSCLFFERFTVGNEEIQFRLDFNDPEHSEHPVLDADFYRVSDGKKLNLKGARREAHHTYREENNSRTYYWCYKGYSKPLGVSITWCASSRFGLALGLNVEVEITRTTNDKS
ncbi:hypothetical protein [Vibrio maritimus]|uniref:hypothetical protein n=1 Tax=Vibrio maritimus TaxID=990268 RepID=UPI003736971E